MSKFVIDESKTREFYWIRHPKTEVGYSVCYGNTDYKVNANILQETADTVQKKLNGLVPEICYSSPLIRARALAEELFPEHNIQTDSLIKEVHFGEWEGVSWDKISVSAQKRWSEDILNFNEHGGENFKDLQQRVVPFWQKLLGTTHEKVAIVAHAGVIVALLSHLLDADPTKVFRFDIDFGEVVRIRVRGENFIKIKIL